MNRRRGKTKRSKAVRLVLISALSAAAAAGCKDKAAISPSCLYTNNYYLPGVGYYHAPFGRWYAFPYNHFDPRTRKYYYGGHWAREPMECLTNLSAPSTAVAQQAELLRTDVARGGFGCTSGSHGWAHA